MPAKAPMQLGDADPLIAACVSQLTERYGQEIEAIVLYGSYLRGAAEAMPDLYVLLSRYPSQPRLHLWLGNLLPPNVYHLKVAQQRAKVSVLRTKQLLKAAALDLHPYFWARLAQPSQLVFCRSRKVHARLRAAAARSAERLLHEVCALDPQGAATDHWRRVFARTYAAEMRSEGADKREALYGANQAYYDGLFQAANLSAETARRGPRLPWPLVCAVGKSLSTLRIVKSALTFEDPVDYMLWKLERHSGLRLPASKRQRRHPLLFAWPLVWRLYRLGAFR